MAEKHITVSDRQGYGFLEIRKYQFIILMKEIDHMIIQHKITKHAKFNIF